MAHTTDNYKTGGIIGFLARWIDDSTPPTLPAGYVDVGNIVSWTEEPKVTKKPHKSHRGGTETTDKKVKVKEECTLKFTTDEITLENLRMFYGGDLHTADTIYPLNSDCETYSVKIVEYLASGQALIHEWHKVEVTAAAAVELINHGDGEGDWAKLEFEGEVLDDTVNNPVSKWGKIYVSPSA